ncbi:hypothetical protein K0B96_11235 [Horticoccus luteus]|uniref:Uncharacterized protein n=1 Tax=Horticoccus luteus TaxID=2862869 RepID=A0A8F9XKA9_9BACT|nr:hypothetical protein [Horticoccus luteus]QYM77889.1 hypothetical protein K0B96_11235 [Horticoccus luteus]
MSKVTVLPSARRTNGNENHHLWNNNGTWFLHYTTYPTPFTKERVRRSLGTKDLMEARLRRDAFFSHLGNEGAAPAAQPAAAKFAVA